MFVITIKSGPPFNEETQHSTILGYHMWGQHPSTQTGSLMLLVFCTTCASSAGPEAIGLVPCCHQSTDDNLATITIVRGGGGNGAWTKRRLDLCDRVQIPVAKCKLYCLCSATCGQITRGHGKRGWLLLLGQNCYMRMALDAGIGLVWR